MALKGMTLKEEPCADEEFTHKELDDCSVPPAGILESPAAVI